MSYEDEEDEYNRMPESSSTSSTTMELELNDTITETQQHILAILPRIAASVSVLCAFYMVFTILPNPYYRGRIYHRLMLGCTFPILILNAAQLWGPCAAPAGTTDWVVGARGNDTTCSVQGFMYQFRMVVPSYYLILALLARRLVFINNNNNGNDNVSGERSTRHDGIGRTTSGSNRSNNRKGINGSTSSRRRRNDDKLKSYLKCLAKMEPYLHGAVYIFPIISGIYLLSIQGFNMILLGCGVESSPLGCGDDSGITCDRGPQNPGFYQWILVALPFIILLGSSTLIMLVTYTQLYFKPNGGKQIAKSMAAQASLYLLALYWTYIFRWIDAELIFNNNTYIFGVNLLAETIDPLQGLWTLLVYWYFKSDPPSEIVRLPVSGEDMDDDHSESVIFESSFKKDSSGLFSLSSRGGGNRSGGDNSERSSRSSRSFRPEFSIFDGSHIQNKDSPWAAFLVDDGEDDDYGQEQAGGNREYTDRDFDSTIRDVKLTSLSKAKYSSSTKSNQTERTVRISTASSCNTVTSTAPCCIPEEEHVLQRSQVQKDGMRLNDEEGLSDDDDDDDDSSGVIHT